MKKLLIMSLLVPAMLACYAGEAKADTDPRDYSGIMALPSKTAVALVYERAYSTSDTSSLTQNLTLLRATYVLKWGNFLLDPLDFILPVADVTVHVPIPNAGGLSGTIHGSGIGDFIYVPTVVYEIPEGENSSSFMGASEYVTMPTGGYNDTKLLNIGANHWTFKSEAMLGQKFAKRMTFEVLGNISAFTANDDLRTANGEIHSLHNLPVEGFEAHYMVDIAPYFSVAGSYYLTANGRAHLAFDDAATTAPQQTVQSLRGTFAIRVEKQSLLFLQFQNDIAASNGASITRFVGARISHFF